MRVHQWCGLDKAHDPDSGNLAKHVRDGQYGTVDAVGRDARRLIESVAAQRIGCYKKSRSRAREHSRTEKVERACIVKGMS